MMNLQSSHPEAYSQLAAGEFAVQRSTCTPRQLAFDLTIEQTMNRDTKTNGGIIFSRKPSAVQKWVLNAHQKAEIVLNCHLMAGLDLSQSGSHKDQQREK